MAIDRLEKEWLVEQMQRVTTELDEIHKIGIALSTVRDHDVLLPMILTKARELSRSDAGSLYLLDRVDGEGVLRWKLAQNDSIQVDFQEMTLPITEESLAGYVALTGATLSIADAYDLPGDVPYADQQLLRSSQRLSHALDARLSDGQPQWRDHRRSPAHQSQEGKRSSPSDRGDGSRVGDSVRRPGDPLDAVSRRGRWRRRREQLSLRVDRAAVRGVRDRLGHRHRAARSDDFRTFVPRR
jgi:hypothetical protein